MFASTASAEREFQIYFLQSEQKTVLDFHQKAYVCIEVFNAEKPVLLVSRLEGDWCFLCGAPHPDDASYYRVVGIGHVIQRNDGLSDILDLRPGEEAERPSLHSPWVRTYYASPEDVPEGKR